MVLHLVVETQKRGNDEREKLNHRLLIRLHGPGRSLHYGGARTRQIVGLSYESCWTQPFQFRCQRSDKRLVWGMLTP